MKTERRHELKTNELAGWIGSSADRIRPYLTGLVGAGVAVILLGGFYYYLRTAAQTRRTEAFDAFFDATSSQQGGLERLDDLGREYPDEPAGLLAQLTAADFRLNSGVQMLFTDRATAGDELRKALQGYEDVRANSKDPLLLQLALWGAARTHESLGYDSPAEIKSAIELYSELAKTYPKAPLAKEASRRVADLQRNSTLQFYDWFATVNPAPPVTPGEGSPFGEGFELDALPDGPDIDTPAGTLPTDPTTPSDSTLPPDTTAPSEGAAPTETPPTEAPASGTPPATPTP